MGKIRQLREDQLINGGSQEHIYPITHSKAVYTEDKEQLQDALNKVKSGDYLSDSVIKTRHIADKNVTNEKIADDTLTLDKFDADLRNFLEAATGLPSDIIERFQNMSEDIAELQDSTYPIVLSMSVSFVNPTHTISFNVKNKGNDFVGDTLSLTKTLGNGTVKTLSNIPAASGIAQSPIEYNKETFKLEVGAKGHTTKSTSTTRYICYAGGNVSDTITEGIIKSLSIYSATSVAFNPTVNTQDNQYIWLVVPSYLTISRVTSSGFNVTLAAVQTITTALGEFKAYRTANVLTAQKWNLVIS